MHPPIFIDSTEGSAYLAEMQRQGGIVALLGSAVSIWHPSNMPSGQSVTERFASLFAARAASDSSLIAERIRKTAFEHIMERYPKPDILRPIVARAYYPTAPNPVHEAFARLLNAGVIEHIITTNYDVGLEAACSVLCDDARRPQVIVRVSDAATTNRTAPVLFKIHGCARPGNEDTIVLTLGGEGEMPDWKRELLAQLINGKHLLVCGYSGLDFEVSPELERLAPARTTWNCLKNPDVDEEALTPNARRVLNTIGGTPLVGDMNRMLQSLTSQHWSSDSSRVSPDLVGSLVAALDEWELDRWRVWVLNGLGCAIEGAHVARRMYEHSGSSGKRRSDSLLALAESLFHGGFYKQASATYREAALGLRSLGDWEQVVKAEVGVMESDRVAGRWLRARRRASRLAKRLPAEVPPELKEKARGEIELKRLLLRRYPFYLSKVLRLRPLTERIRAQAKQELHILSASFARQGSWFNLQHCEMLAGRFGIPFAEIYEGTMMPLASREGYRHLGYVVAEMMAYRALLADVNVLEPPLHLEYILLARELGINPEVWKLARAIEKRFGGLEPALDLGSIQRNYRTMSLPSPDKLRRLALASWKACEYTVSMRLLLRVRGEEA